MKFRMTLALACLLGAPLAAQRDFLTADEAGPSRIAPVTVQGIAASLAHRLHLHKVAT